MREFSMTGFAAHLLEMAAAEENALRAGLKKCAQAIEKTAREEIGTYQPEVGPFNAWPALEDSTIKQHERMGAGDTPLLVTGELRDTLGYQVEGNKAVIGSTSDLMVYQELGTPTIPPRPVLGPAAISNKELIEHTMGHAAAGMLYGAGAAWTDLEAK